MPSGVKTAELCKIFDAKGDLGWALYDPHSPVALRVLSTEVKPPSENLFKERFERAWTFREPLKLTQTNAFRLFNGEGDLLPGLVCDVYDKVAIVQFDGKGAREFWNSPLIVEWLIAEKGYQAVYEKSQRGNDKIFSLLGGTESEPIVKIKENGAQFLVDIEKGQKTGFFLDQRENRNYLKSIVKNKTVLNLFSYTGGFSVYAGLGQAQKVASLDVSKGAIEASANNWVLNGLGPAQHEGLCVDVFEYLNATQDIWDHVLVDPPSMSHSEEQKKVAMLKYTELFAKAAKRVKPGGQISLSSCSSHISFEDFFTIIDEALSQSRRRGQIYRVSGQGFDHPFPHACHELRYLKFVHLGLD